MTMFEMTKEIIYGRNPIQLQTHPKTLTSPPPPQHTVINSIKLGI